MRPGSTPPSATKAASRRISKSAEDALDLIMQAIEKAGYKPGERVLLALDLRGHRVLTRTASLRLHEGEGKKRSAAGAWSNYLAELDRQATRSSRSRTAWREDDWEGWKMLTDKLGDKVPARRRRSVRHQREAPGAKASKNGIANSILVKVNQIGTLTETLAAVEMAHKAGYTAVMSHRSGETEDATIADLAVATNCGQIKTGSLARTDRMAKYNQLLRIEEELGSQAKYAGTRGRCRSRR